MGEAAKGLPEKLVKENPQVPWSDMAGMRDVLIHAYHRVDPQVVWKAAVDHAIPMLPILEELLVTVDAQLRDEGLDSQT